MVDRRETRRRTVQQGVNNSILVIPASLEGAHEPDALAIEHRWPRLLYHPGRLIFTTGFALSLFLVLVSYLDDRMGKVAVFAFLSVGFFWLLSAISEEPHVVMSVQ